MNLKRLRTEDLEDYFDAISLQFELLTPGEQLVRGPGMVTVMREILDELKLRRDQPLKLI